MPRLRPDGDVEMTEEDELSYRIWCAEQRLDPDDLSSVLRYEELFDMRGDEG